MLGVTLFNFQMPLPAIVLGALTGITYGLMAVGLVLIYRTSRIINFAQGQMGIFGVAVMGLLFNHYHFPYYLAVVPALVVGGATGGATELIVIRRLRRAPRIMTIIATLGVASLLASIAVSIYPGVDNASSLPSPTGMPSVELGALLINQAYMAMLIFGPAAVIALTWFLHRTRLGLGIRCSSANPDAARMAGISASNMSSLAWIIAGVLSAMTAILVIPASGFVSTTSFGPSLLLRALVAGVIARMYSMPIAFVSGIGIGIVEQLLLYNYPQSGVTDVVLYLVILGVLLFQRSIRGREEEKGSWAAVVSWRPLSQTVSRLPEIRAVRWAALIVGLCVGLVLPLLVSDSSTVILSTILCFSIVGLSVGVLAGLGGQLSLGQFAVGGVGAAAAYQLSQWIPFPFSLVVAGVAGAGISIVIGVPALRLKGLMLTVTTLGFALMAADWGLGQNWALGEGVTMPTPGLFGIQLTTSRSFYYVVLAGFLACLLVVRNIRRHSLGRTLLAIRDNEDVARAFTISARSRKLQAFMVAGFIAGIGGALYAYVVVTIDPTTYPVDGSIDAVAMTVVGGVGILLGPFLGAVYIIGLPQFVSLSSAQLAATSAGWLVLILYLPGGISQGVEPLRNRYVTWAARRHHLEPSEERAEPKEKVPETGLVSVSRRPHVDTASKHPLLEGRKLKRSFGGIVAVNDVSVSVDRGEIVGLIGPNGAGKTTLFELLSGFTRLDSGRILFENVDVSRLPPERRGRLGLIRSFQDAALFSTLTVQETLSLAFEPQMKTSLFESVLGLPTSEKQRRAKASELLELMGLGPFRTKQIQELSTGTRRITELACTVALSPSLLLLDEPSSGVAQSESEALAVLLRRLKKELSLTLLIIEHDIPLIMGLSDRVIAMEAGYVLAQGTPHEIQTNSSVIEAYLGTNARAINRSHVTAMSVPATSEGLG